MLRQLAGVTCLFGLLACSGADVETTSVAHESLEVLRAGQPNVRAAARASIERSTSRLCDLAADHFGDPARNGSSDADPDDGGWDWVLAPTSSEHSVDPSPDNLYGAVALAPWAGLRLGLSPLRNSATLYNAYWGARQNPNVDSPPDFVFLSLLSDVFHDGPLALARERYDAKVAAAGSATALADSIRETHRTSASDGLFAYDLAWLALGAAALDVKFPRADYRDDFRAYVAVALDDLDSATPLFDVRDAREPYYTQGLAWSLLLLSWAHGAHATYDDVRSRLLASQLANGAFPYNADFPDAHLQATAHVVMALALTHHGHAAPRAVSDAAADWLISAQNENGGFTYASQEYPLLDAEISLALYLAETLPGARSGLRPRGLARAAFALASDSTLPPLAAPLSAP